MALKSVHDNGHKIKMETGEPKSNFGLGAKYRHGHSETECGKCYGNSFFHKEFTIIFLYLTLLFISLAFVNISIQFYYLLTELVLTS